MKRGPYWRLQHLVNACWEGATVRHYRSISYRRIILLNADSFRALAGST